MAEKSLISMITSRVEDRARASSRASQRVGCRAKHCKFVRNHRCNSLGKIPFTFILHISANKCIATPWAPEKRAKRVPDAMEISSEKALPRVPARLQQPGSQRLHPVSRDNSLELIPKS
jgi:hypothetical protein